MFFQDKVKVVGMMLQDALLYTVKSPLGAVLTGQGGPQMARRLAHGVQIDQFGRKGGEDVAFYVGSWVVSSLQDGTVWSKMVTR